MTSPNLSIALGFLLFWPSVLPAAETWFKSIETAAEQAQKKNLPILVKFSGSDWCAPCQEIQKKVFGKERFQQEAGKQFILCVIDSPQADQEVANKNKPILKKFRIVGFPTVLLLDPKGKEFARFNPGAYDTTQKMLDQLKDQLRRKEMF